MARASASVAARGFSQATCLPAARAARTISRCLLFGVVTSTRSTSGSATAAAQSVVWRAQPQRSANAASSAAWRATTVCMTGVTGSSSKNRGADNQALEWARPMNFWPIRQTLSEGMGELGVGSWELGDGRRESGVGSRESGVGSRESVVF